MSVEINKSVKRIGNFTSSEIAALMSNPTAKAQKEGEIFGAPAKTYIQEANFERKLKRSLTDETFSKATSWGSCVEKHAFEQLGIQYKFTAHDSILHDSLPWAGSPDGFKFDEGKTVIDLKCPFTLKSFCQMVECKTIQELRDNYTYGEKYYWQLVSNSILTNSRFAELIIYCPYFNELQAIRTLAMEDIDRFYWITKASDDELPYLLESGGYENLNIIRFEVSEADKDLLKSRVYEASKLLISNA